MLTIFAIRAFTDNYIWCLRHHDRTECIVVDPGDAASVIKVLHVQGLRCIAILLTHHHFDHVGGAVELRARYDVPIYGLYSTAMPMVTHPVHDGALIDFSGFDVQFEVMTIPGHTLDHIAYFSDNYLFCGDTLFSAGCGRLFEGTAEQMVHSLRQIMQLPETTAVYCAHEYTLKNLQFAHWVEPKNQAVLERLKVVMELRTKDEITLPSSLGLEKAINPFLRLTQPDIIAFLSQQTGQPITDEINVFATLRHLKDQFNP